VLLRLTCFGFSGQRQGPRSGSRTSRSLAEFLPLLLRSWATQVSDFVASWSGISAGGPLKLVGNSSGGLVALRACQVLESLGIAPNAVILMTVPAHPREKRNAKLRPLSGGCGRLVKAAGASSRRSWPPLFRIWPSLLIRQVLAKGLSPVAPISDASSCEILHRPSTIPGAGRKSFRDHQSFSIDSSCPELLATCRLPVRLLWGERDPWESPRTRWSGLNNSTAFQEL